MKKIQSASIDQLLLAGIVWWRAILLRVQLISGAAAASLLLAGQSAGVDAQLRLPSLVKPLKPYCRVDIEGAESPVLASRRVSPASIAATYVDFVPSAMELVIDLDQSDTKAVGGNIRISAKTFQDESFKEICSAIDLNKKSRFVIAAGTMEEAPLDAESPTLWRVEVFVNPGIDGVLELSYRGASYSSQNSFFSLPRELLWASGFLCSNGMELSSRRNGSSFSTKSILTVEIAETRLSLKQEQKDLTYRELLHALSLWSHACATCLPNHFMGIRIDDKLFLRQGLVNWYDTEFALPPTGEFNRLDISCLAKKKLGDCFVPAYRTAISRQEGTLFDALEAIKLLTAGTGAAPRGKAFERYVEVEDPRVRFSKLCKEPRFSKSAPMLATVQATLCATSHNDPPDAIISFSPEITSCGSGNDVIACRADTQLIEYNTYDFKFLFGEDKFNSIGSGPIEVSLLHALIHELGHWIGLSHEDVGESIMASSLKQSRCIDPHTTNRLTSLLRGFSGLRRGHPIVREAFRMNPLPNYQK